MQDLRNSPEVYISYAWGSESESIVEKIESNFHGRGISTVRDKKDLKYKGLIKDFMKQLGQGKYIVVVVNQKYLQSENCMFELLQIFKNNQFYDRIFPILLDEVDISKAEDRVKLVKFWEDKVEALDNEIRNLKELSNIQGVSEDLNLYTEIRNNIANLTNIIKDINSLSVQKHVQSNFQELLERLEEKIAFDQADSNNPARNEIRPSLGKSAKYGGVAVILVLGIWLLSQLPKNPGNELSDRTLDDTTRSTIALDMDSVRTMEERRSLNKQPVPAKNKADELIFYQVQLVVPSNMMNGSVSVDGEPAEIISKDLTFITVRVTKKSGSHNFTIKDGNNACQTDQLISEDDLKLTLCN